LNLMPANDALAIGGSGPSHVHCRLFVVQFADGSSWVDPRRTHGDTVGRDAAAGVPQAVFITAPIVGPVPMGFIRTQKGTAVRLRDMTSSDAGYCGMATVENYAHEAVTGIRFEAIALTGGPERSNLSSALHTASPVLAVDVPADGIATVVVDLLTLDDLRQTVRTGSPQVMCAISEIRYADGSQWTSPPATAIGLQNAEVSRAVLGGAPVAGASLCRDQDGGEYSNAAVVPIAGDGRFARCHHGAWAEYELPPQRPDPVQ
jgi:hypothetical protein